MSWRTLLVRGSRLSLVLTLGLLLAPAARAGTVSHTGTYALSPYLNGGTYAFAPASFPKFDVAGQCLTSVCVKLDGGLYGEIGFENYQSYPVTVNVTFTGTLTVKRPDNTPLVTVQPTTTTTDNLPGFDGTLDYGGASGRTYTGVNPTQSGSQCFTGAADLALFTGAGTINLPMSATDLCTQTGASSWSLGAKAYATVTVTYEYTDCSVPGERPTWGRLKDRYR